MEVDSLVPIASRTNTWINKHRIIKGWPLYCTISLAKLTFIKSISSTIPTRLPKLFLPTQNQRRKNWKSDFGECILPPNYFTFLIKALRRRAEVVSAEIVIAPPRRTIEPVANVRRSGGIIWPFVSSLYIVRLEEFTVCYAHMWKNVGFLFFLCVCKNFLKCWDPFVSFTFLKRKIFATQISFGINRRLFLVKNIQNILKLSKKI